MTMLVVSGYRHPDISNANGRFMTCSPPPGYTSAVASTATSYPTNLLYSFSHQTMIETQAIYLSLAADERLNIERCLLMILTDCPGLCCFTT